MENDNTYGHFSTTRSSSKKKIKKGNLDLDTTTMSEIGLRYSRV